MKPNRQALLAILSVLTILGSGVLMSVILLKADQAQVSQEEWATFATRLANLEQWQASFVTSPAPKEPSPTALIPINHADQSLLEELPGIGPARAAAILEARNNGGPFQDLADLDVRVPSIPASVLKDIESKISFD